ncbi:MAG: FtsW/RodA/SpoVE family cell cycle protein [Chitinophagaceae bacterium]
MAETIKIEKSFQLLLKNTRGDKYIWGAVFLLILASILVVYSATGSLAYKMNHGHTEIYLFKQVFFTLAGLVLIYILHRVNYTFFSRAAQILYMLSIPLLVYTLFFGAEINDGSRWIKLPIINMTFQTSDFAKLALFMYLSRQLSRKQMVIKDFKKGFLPLIIPIGLTCILIMPANLSNALLTGATSLVLLFIGRVRGKHILMVIGLALIPITILVSTAVLTHKDSDDLTAHETTTVKSVGVFKRMGTWVTRVQDFIYASGDEKEAPYQVQQAKIAIANGGVLYGLGPGNSRQRNFLPQAYNDFIFSIIIEEYGLLGGGFIMFIYLVFMYRCIRIFRRCPYAFGAFLALGLSFTLVIQAMANMAVNVNIVPVTGVTLPLVSMGGSSFLFTCTAIGLILSVARNVEIMEGKRSAIIAAEVKKEDAEEAAQ